MPGANKIKVKKVIKKQRGNDTASKTKSNWIDQCYEQTMLSDPHWNKILEKIGRKLAVKLQKRLDESITDDVSRQVLFAHLGKSYVDKHFVSYKYDESILGSEDLMPDEHDRIAQRMKKVVENDVNEAYEELGYKNLSNTEMKEYRNIVKKTFNDALEKRLQENQKRRQGEEKPANIIGKALMNVLHRNPSSIISVIGRLKDQSLPMPNTLRKYVYIHQTMNKAIERDNTVREDIMRVKKQILDVLKESKTSCQAIQPIRAEEWKIIDKTVIDTYHNTTGMNGIDTDEHLMTTSRVLNLLDICTDNYRPALIYWLCPFLLAFESHSSLLRDEAVVEVATLLTVVDNFLIPTTAQIFSITHKAVDVIVDNDKSFFNHLLKCCKVDPFCKPEDFTVPTLHIDNEKAVKLMSDISENPKAERSVKIATNPQTYIRRWVIDGFIQCLRLESALFLWDQLFFSSWDHEMIQRAVIIIMMLLKPWFLRADNYAGIRRVFLDEPARLYTADIRRAWRHLQENRMITDIPLMNRNILQYNVDPPPAPAVYKPPPESLVSPPPLPVIIPDPPSSSESEPEPEPPQLTETETESEEESEPEPEPEPKTKPGLDKREDIFGAWLPFDKRIQSELPPPTRITSGFNLYVDAIRFLPDNATVVKITGKIINGERIENMDQMDIIAYANLSSPGKCPEFDCKLLVKENKILLNPNVMILFRVYTVETITNEVVLLGSCLFSFFQHKPEQPYELKVGGHQLRLKRGYPKNGISSNITANDMDDNLPIPAATILIRLLPPSEETIPMPKYDTHYYQSRYCVPTESECYIYEDYMQRPNRNETVIDVLKNKLRSKKNDVEKSMIQKLEIPKKKDGVRLINLSNLINYNQNNGMALLVEEAHRLPVHMSGKFFQVLLQMLPGKSTLQMSKTFSVLTEKLEMESSHLDPNWMDPPTKVKPLYDERSVLFIQLFGLNAEYEKGKVTDKDGNHLSLNIDTPLAWTVVPLFKNGAVNVGTFLVPLIKHYPTTRLVQAFQNQPVEVVFKSIGDQIKFCEGSSIEVTLWDGHFITSECPPLMKNNVLIKMTPKPAKYLNAIDARNQTSFVDLLIKRLIQKEGPQAWNIGSDTTKLQEGFLKSFNAQFSRLINDGLRSKRLNPVSHGGLYESDEDNYIDYDTD